MIAEHGPLAAICAWLLWERRDVSRALRKHTEALIELRLVIERVSK